MSCAKPPQERLNLAKMPVLPDFYPSLQIFLHGYIRYIRDISQLWYAQFSHKPTHSHAQFCTAQNSTYMQISNYEIMSSRSRGFSWTLVVLYFIIWLCAKSLQVRYHVYLLDIQLLCHKSKLICLCQRCFWKTVNSIYLTLSSLSGIIYHHMAG